MSKKKAPAKSRASRAAITPLPVGRALKKKTVFPPQKKHTVGYDIFVSEEPIGVWSEEVKEGPDADVVKLKR